MSLVLNIYDFLVQSAAKLRVFKLTHALCGLGRPFETLNSKRKLFYYHSVTPQYRTRGVNLLYAQRTAMPHSPTSDRCDQLIFRGNIHKLSGISSVVDFDKLALLVELQFDAVGQLEFVAPVRE